MNTLKSIRSGFLLPTHLMQENQHLLRLITHFLFFFEKKYKKICNIKKLILPLLSEYKHCCISAKVKRLLY